MNITISDTSFIDGLIARVDQEADDARQLVVGDPVRVKEYEIAQQQAEAFRDAGYQGEAMPYVHCWAVAKAWTDRQAADDILAAAARWLAALEGIRALRLQAKETIRGSANHAAAQGAFDDYLQQLASMMDGVA